MLVSVFTPTHKVEFLSEAYQSLTRQTYRQWQWVLIPNGAKASIPASIAGDSRVKIIPTPDAIAAAGVGALKRFACEQCEGEYLVELDHDDFLTADALEKIVAAARRYQPGFIYSDYVNFYSNHSSKVFDPKYGWESYPFEYDGRRYTAIRSFTADPAALSNCQYAPFHVRAWHREAYQKAGGYDATRRTLEDHDLVCRTYLIGARFHHIDECLYFYRLQDFNRNTHLQELDTILTEHQALADKYRYGLLVSWCLRNDYPLLDLGGRTNSPEGYTSMDLLDADIVCDLGRNIPVADQSVGCVRAYDFLEHIPPSSDPRTGMNGDRLGTVALMNEIYRVLKPGGWLITRTPSTDGRGAFQDPTHVSFWNPSSFLYYTSRQLAQYIPAIQCRFQSLRVQQSFPSDWHKQHNVLYVYADLVALKGQHQAGYSDI
jgi:glycosyltransferase involved in cell wall biosynthesis